MMKVFPKMISLLLQYPSEEIMASLGVLEERVPELPDENAKRVCAAFLDYLRRTSLLRLQEEYTRTFDLDPSTSLNLSHHKWGDDRERGSGMAALSRLYGAAGFEMTTGELPDYLPLVLEFLAVCPEGAGRTIKADYGKEVQALVGRLQGRGSPYGALLGLAADLFHSDDQD